MELKDNSFKEKYIWKREYSIVLALNILYILYFAYLMLTHN